MSGETSIAERQAGLTPGWKKVFTFLMFLPILLAGWRHDDDFWFLLNSGRYVLAHGIPHTEPFTIHEGFHFVMQQWLGAVTFELAYRALGWLGMILLLMALFALTLLVMYRLCLLVSEGNFFVSFAVMIVIGWGLTIFVIDRPQSFSILLIACELSCLERYCRGSWKWLLPLPLLSVLQINLHGAMWPMLFVVLLPYFAELVLGRFRASWREHYRALPLLLAGAAMAAAGLVNPYGTETMTYLYRSYGHWEISDLINEMQPITVNSWFGRLFFALLFLIVLCFIRYRDGKFKVRYFFLLLGPAYMALSSIRSFWLFLTISIFPMAYYFKDRGFPPQSAPTERTRRLRSILVGSLAILILFSGGLRIYRELHADRVPECGGAVDYLLKNTEAAQVRLYTNYNFGGYAEYMGFRCYIDSRAEVFVIENNGTDDVMEEYAELQLGDLNYRDFLSKYHFTHLIVDKSDTLWNYLPNEPGYKMVYEDDDCAVFEATGTGVNT